MILNLEIKQIISAARLPRQDPFVERVIGTIRRECTDHVIAFGERQLRRDWTEYVGYYNESRTHQSLVGKAPEPRMVKARVQVVAQPVLAGLHHRYLRKARVERTRLWTAQGEGQMRPSRIETSLLR